MRFFVAALALIPGLKRRTTMASAQCIFFGIGVPFPSRSPFGDMDAAEQHKRQVTTATRATQQDPSALEGAQ